MAEYIALLREEEEFYKVKSRVTWLMCGDKNTCFFHWKATTHTARNCILSLQNENGVSITEYEQVQAIAVDFYKHLFSQPGVDHFEHANKLQGVTTKPVKDEYVNMLQASVTLEEIKQAVFSMLVGKAPGPDGFTVEFYKHNWAVVGDDVVRAMKYCFEHIYVYYPLNSTILTLLLKIPNAMHIREFRPIASCNVLCKCYSV